MSQFEAVKVRLDGAGVTSGLSLATDTDTVPTGALRSANVYAPSPPSATSSIIDRPKSAPPGRGESSARANANPATSSSSRVSAAPVTVMVPAARSFAAVPVTVAVRFRALSTSSPTAVTVTVPSLAIRPAAMVSILLALNV